MSLSAQALTYQINSCRLLNAVDFSVSPSEIVAVLGNNGAGKSTLLNTLAGCPQPSSGQVFLEDKPLAEWSWDEIARRRSMLTQFNTVAFDFPVNEVVSLGALPHQGRASPQQIQTTTDKMLAWFDISTLRERRYTALSGGECQRTQLARVFLQAMLGLASSPVYILLDEPLAGLDIVHQHRLLQRLHDSAAEGAGIVMVTHDPNVALHHANRVVLMQAGSIYCDGHATEVITANNLRAVFQVETTFVTAADGRTYIIMT